MRWLAVEAVCPGCETVSTVEVPAAVRHLLRAMPARSVVLRRECEGCERGVAVTAGDLRRAHALDARAEAA